MFNFIFFVSFVCAIDLHQFFKRHVLCFISYLNLINLLYNTNISHGMIMELEKELQMAVYIMQEMKKHLDIRQFQSTL